jgi:hypothetical protein
MDFRTSPTGSDLATAAWGGDAWLAVNSAYLEAMVNQPNGTGNLLGGGGYSQFFSVPAWQAGVVPPSAPGRGVPDIALPASGIFPGIAMTLGGQSTTLGGTSMAAPLFAGYLADIAAQSGQRFGDVNPTLYAAAAQNPTLMTQAQYGYDGLWSVSPGPWNPLTGLGTPNIDTLAGILGLPLAPTAIAFDAAATWVNAGHPVALPVSLTTSSGAVVTAPTVVHLTIRGPGSYGTRTAIATASQGLLSPLRFVAAGTYTVTGQVGAVQATTTVLVAPGWPGQWKWLGPNVYVPGHVFREGLAAYDVYGNLDTRIRGTVTWTWQVGGHVYHAPSQFQNGVAWGQFVVPDHATGLLRTSVQEHWWQAPLP